MKFFDADEVHERLDYPSLVEALCEHHLRDIDDVRSLMLDQPTPSGATSYFLTLPAWQRGRAIGAKLVTVFPDNEHTDTGLPSVQAVYVLFDGETGKPRACIDGTALTLRKTAGDSAMGARFLAPQEAKTMLMVGAGAMAPHLIMAHRAVRPGIEHVEIWNRTPERAQTLATTLQQDGIAATAVTDIEVAARKADVISCATMATDPLIKGAWLKPGSHLDLVGSYMPSQHECDQDAIARASVFVDSMWSALVDCGEMVTALESGLLTKDKILSDNFRLARGEHPGRTSDDEITLYKNGGGGHLDLMVAQHLCSAI